MEFVAKIIKRYNTKYPDKFIIQQTIRFNKTLNLTYINNAKVACSTIKKTLWVLSNEVNHNVSKYYGNAHICQCLADGADSNY